MKNFAEILRWIGALTILVGGIGVFLTAGLAVAPYVVEGFKWLSAQIGLSFIFAALIFVGLGVFHLGECISPHIPSRT